MKAVIQKKWSEERRHIKALSKSDLKLILTKGRYPNNNTFPPLYDLSPTYKYSSNKIEYLCPRENKTPRKYCIPDEIAYLKLVNAISNAWLNEDNGGNFSNPESILGLISSNKKIIPISSCLFKPELSNKSLKKIYLESVYKWKRYTQHYLYEDSLDYKYLLELDIKDFYTQIYIHSIPWALTGNKERCKNLSRTHKTEYKKLLCSKIESALMDLQDRQTNGIPIGPLGSDIIGEVVLCRVVKNVERILKQKSFIGTRFKDDFKILCKTKEDAEKILEVISDELYKFNLYLNDDKTHISQDFSGLVLKDWYKKIIKLPSINYSLENKEPTNAELRTLENELFAVMIAVTESIKPSDGNFWYEFDKRYRKYLKVISDKYPEGKERIVVWFIGQLKDYPAHTGAILNLLMSLISIRDSKYLKKIRKRLAAISGQKNFDFCMIWLIYFLGEKYLSKKYEPKLNEIFDDMRVDIEKISNIDIKKESENLLNYILRNRDKLSGIHPITKTFKTDWRVWGNDYE